MPSFQLPTDPHVAPARVLAPQPYHQRSGLPAKRWSAWLSLRARRSPTHELPMPAAQRVRTHQQAGASLARQKQRRRRQHRPLPRPELKSPALLSGEQLDLVAQHDRLELALAVRPAGQQRDEAAQEPVDQRPQHSTAVSQRTSAPINQPYLSRPIEFLYPTGVLHEYYAVAA